MASVFSSLRNIASDNWWVVKVVVFALPVFFVLENDVMNNFKGDEQIIFCAILAIFYFGCVGVAMNRNINNGTPLLPSFFSIPDFLAKAVGTSLSALPMFAFYAYVIYLIKTQLVLEPFVLNTVLVCTSLFLAPFLFIPTVLYSVNGKILDSFNLKVIFLGAGNVFVALLSYVVQYIFTIFFLAFLLYKLFTQMINDSLLVNVVYSLTFVFTILSFYIYCSDLYDEQIPRLPEKKKKLKKRKN